MAISKKPSRKKKDSSAVDALIEKGGSVPGEKKQSPIKAFPMRLREDVVEMIDDVVKDSPIIPSRNAWIANAVYEQLKREGRIEK